MTDEQKTLDEMETKTNNLIPVHMVTAWGSEATPVELRGYATQLAFLTPEQINGEYRFLLTQLMTGLQRMSDENARKENANE